MRTWFVALRIARREARRAKGRTALVVAMIGLPIAVLSLAAAVIDMARLTPSEQVTRQMGAAAAAVRWTPDQIRQVPAEVGDASSIGAGGPLTGAPSSADLVALLPAGSTATQVWSARIAVRTAGGVGAVSAQGIDAANPLTRGIVRVLAGRVPRSIDEVAASPAALARLGARVGETVRALGSNDSYTIVGIVEIGGQHDQTLLFEPSARPATQTGAYRSSWLVGQRTPVVGHEIESLNAKGFLVVSRQLVLRPPPTPAFHGPSGDDVQNFGIGTLLVGLAVLEVVLLAGPAFAVGARRRQHDLALIAAGGGPPSTLRRIMLADGVVCGAIAAASGLALGLGLAFGGRSFVESHFFDSDLGGYRVFPWAVAGVIVVSVGIGLLGALLPAVSAGRQDIVASLSGRRGVTRVRRRWVIGGVTLIVLGAVLTGYGATAVRSGPVLAGLALVEFGLVMCTPALVGLIAGLGRFLPLAPRLALRDAARRRSATAPAIAAVMAAVAGSVAITVYVSAQRAANVETYAFGTPLGTVTVWAMQPSTGNYVTGPVTALTTAAHSALPGATVVPFQVLSCPYAPNGPQPSGLCGAQLVLPVDRKCPFEAFPSLTKAQTREALADPRCNTSTNEVFGYTQTVVTDSPGVVAAVSGLTAGKLDAATATLRAGGILVSDTSYVEHGFATLDLAAEDGSTHTMRVPAYAVQTGVRWFQPVYSPNLLNVTHNTAVQTGILATPRGIPTQAAEDALNALTLDAASDINIYVERGHVTGHDPSVALLLSLAAAVIALGAAAIATGLAATDSRRDLITLGAVGATPRVRRMLSLAQAAVISGTGSLIGVLAGFGMSVAVLIAMDRQWAQVWPRRAYYPITVPWLNFAVALVAVPLVAMLGAGLLTRSRLPSERRAD
ncbi:MAG TPA: FtsX-like permease family protein [Micromonosporaceae bacterium]|nr:FtsX-like permease family protein [Micromonosporaceae bacterium]